MSSLQDTAKLLSLFNVPGHGDSFNRKFDRPMLAEGFYDLGIFDFSLSSTEYGADAIRIKIIA